VLSVLVERSRTHKFSNLMPNGACRKFRIHVGPQEPEPRFHLSWKSLEINSLRPEGERVGDEIAQMLGFGRSEGKAHKTTFLLPPFTKSWRVTSHHKYKFSSFETKLNDFIKLCCAGAKRRRQTTGGNSRNLPKTFFCFSAPHRASLSG
jgi:hypothetical protein